MPQFKKFIITTNKTVSDLLIAHGFHLLTNISGTYTFINKQKSDFNFSNVDMNQVYFTNILHI